MYTGWGKNRANTFSLWGRGRDRLYSVINSYNMGQGLVFLFLHSKTLLGFYLLFPPWVTTVGWHERLNGHEFEQALGDGERQISPACCSPLGRKESDTTV